MELDPQNLRLLVLGSFLAVFVSFLCVRALQRLYLSAQPDEWLLIVRDGKLVRAGIGIARWRLPGEVVVRFSSTVQRVSFSVEVLSEERVSVLLDGFLFWRVGDEAKAAFQAFSRLGIADGLRGGSTLRHPKHLLTSPQHKAFQQMLSAIIQRYAASLPLDELLGDQDDLLRGLTERLQHSTEDLGILVNHVELSKVRVADAVLQSRLAMAATEALREKAETLRLETEERMLRTSAEAARDRAVMESRCALEQSQQQSLLEAQRRSLRLEELSRAHALVLEEQRLHAEAQLAEEAHQSALQRARNERALSDTQAELARKRFEAEAQRDIALLLTEAEERKSPAVRAHERALILGQKFAEGLKITDAKWISLGEQNPLTSLGTLVEGMRSLVD